MGNLAACFAVVVGEEGGLSLVAADPGNWTGGAVGRGHLVGTKYGIAASAFPNLAIATLTLSQAQAIYAALYWRRVQGDALPAGLALLVFDAAVNNGVSAATRWLQQALGVRDDGAMGPQTLAAVRRAPAGDGLAAEFLARRMVAMAAMAAWRDFGLGWARRLCALPYRAKSFMQTGS